MNLPANNPYNYNLPVGLEMFFGRQSDSETLLYNLTANPGDSYALIGGRRMGKTSLLEALLRDLEVAPASLPVLPMPVWLDLTGEGIQSAIQFFQRVLEDVQFRLAEILGSSPEMPSLAQGQPPAPILGRVLPQWERAILAKCGRRLRLILLLDECEQIAAHDWAPDLYSSLRHLLVGPPTRSILKVVMVGSHGFLTRVRQEGSPLRNVLQYHTLRALSPEATRQLVTRPTHNSLAESVVQAVLEQSGGHAFLTQYIMHHLWQQGLDRATPESVQKIALAFPHERSDFQDWLAGLGPSGALIYRALATASGPIKEDLLRQSVQPYPPDFLQALDALCYHSLVVEQDGQYRVAGQMFRHWFEHNVVISVNAQENQPVSNQSSVTIEVKGDLVYNKPVGIDQRDQQVQGPQTNLAGDVNGPVLSGQFHGPVQTGSGVQIGNISNVHGGEINIAGKDLIQDQRQVNIEQGNYFEGPVNTAGGDFVGGDKVAGDKIAGDKIEQGIQVGDIKDSTGVAIGHGARATVTQTSGPSLEQITKAFAAIARQVDRLHDDDDKREAKETLKKLEDEAHKGDKADESKVRRWLLFLAEVAPDAFEVAVDTFLNPIKGLGTAFKKVAEKAREERKK